MTQTQKRRHHYVPSGLSRNFCLEPKRLYLYNTKEGVISPTSPKDVFRIKDLHSIVQDDGSIDHNAVEDEMMNFESKGCKAIAEILDRKNLTDERKGWIACFWALQLLRTPFIRGGVETSLKETVRATSRVLDQQGKFGDMPESLKQFGDNFSELLDNGAVDVEISLPQVTMMSLVAWPDVTDFFENMNWCLLTSDSGNYFLLSDTQELDALRSLGVNDPRVLTAGLLETAGVSNLDLSKDFFAAEAVLGNLQDQLIAAGIRSGVDTVISGADLSDSLKQNLRFAGAAVIGAQLSQEIGTEFTKGEIDPTTGISRGVQLIAHAATGCAVGAVGTGNCGAGAAGQLAGEISALLYSGGATQTEIATQTQEWQERGVDIARLSGALASAIAGGGADDINLGSQAGGTAAANNALCGGLCIAAAVGALSAASGYLAVSETARLITEADAAYDAAGGGEAGAKAALLYDSYKKALRQSDCVKSYIVDTAGHTKGWESVWKSLLNKSVDCSKL